MSSSGTVDDLDRFSRAHTRWREHETINLNAATNSLSDRARSALGTTLADKGISSGLHSRHHQGGRYIDAIEERVELITREAFSGGAAEMRPPSGSLANALVIASLVPKNRSIMTGAASALGHFSLREEGWGGRLTSAVLPVPYEPGGVDLDLENLEREVDRHEPAMIVVGSQAMMFPLDLGELRRIADRVGALVVYDAAHPLGLIAGRAFQNPLAEGADILTASTQKSFPGPVGGLIVTRTPELMQPIYSASNQLLSNYQNNRVLSFGYTMAEMNAYGEAYAAACIANARTLAAALESHGIVPLFSSRGFTASNLFLVPWGSHDEAQQFADVCEAANLIVSVTRIPAADDQPALFGLRVGVQDLPRRGMGAEQMAELAGLMARLRAGTSHGVSSGGGASSIETVKERMTELAAAFSTVYYCFETGLPRA